MLLSAKRGALTGKKAVALILLVVGVMLMFFIISQGVGIYKSSREGTDARNDAARCVGFLYTISGITATDEELQFTFRNEISSTEDIHNLTIADSVSKKQSFAVSIPVGASMAVRVPVKVDGDFTVYPDDCYVFPAKCDVEGECAYH
ncbi:hypothetical protein HYY73_06030 [Candidatus Woesearchaeota archaeon]|nr:hypothetical protein [Candidatus Woesearchaeota archaeon]